jgi:hypothetical protein
MTNPKLRALVARLGWRFTTLDAARAGVAEGHLLAAFVRGEVKIERTVANPVTHALISTFVVLA